MLHEWLNPDSVDLFNRNFLRKLPYASPSSAAAATPFFSWDTLDRILRENPPTDALIVRQGNLLDLPVPRTLADVSVLMRQGIGLVIRHAEEHDTGIAEIAASFMRDIPGEAHIQLFVTPGKNHGFSWHYDDEDVFVIQTDGVKDYFFCDNTVERYRPSRTAANFARFHQETSAIGTSRLIPGDWLYIPARWWHVAKCVEDSLSISIGVTLDESWLAAMKQ